MNYTRPLNAKDDHLLRWYPLGGWQVSATTYEYPEIRLYRPIPNNWEMC